MCELIAAVAVDVAAAAVGDDSAESTRASDWQALNARLRPKENF